LVLGFGSIIDKNGFGMKTLKVGTKVRLPNHDFLSDGSVLKVINGVLYVVKNEDDNISGLCFALAILLVLGWTALGATGMLLDMLIVWLKS
jgi:hypothetical protein